MSRYKQFIEWNSLEVSFNENLMKSLLTQELRHIIFMKKLFKVNEFDLM